MQGPSCVVVIDDKGINAKRLSTAWRRPSSSGMERFFLDSNQYWICATNKYRNDPAKANRDLEYFGSTYSEGATLTESMEHCAERLAAIGSRFLEGGLLVYLDVQLDDICMHVDQCRNSAVVDILRKWIRGGKKVFVHVHSTDLQSGRVAKAIDGRVSPSASPGETNVCSTIGLGTTDTNPEDTALVMEMVEESMNAWKQRFPSGIGDYLWTSRTADWFKNDGQPITHNFERAPVEETRKHLQSFLSIMLGDNITDKWLRHATGVECIHSALKHLVGRRSVAQGDGGRNCNLAAATLLLLSACPIKEPTNSGFLAWEPSQHFDMPEILSEAQTSEEAKLAIERLHTMFRKLAVRKRSTAESTLAGLDLERTFLRAYFDFGETNVSSALAALDPTREGGGGDFVTSVREFLDAARVANGRADQRCVVNIFRAPGAANELAVELRPCQSARIVEPIR